MTNFTYTPTGTGAVTRDAANKLRELVSVLDYIPETEHAAIFARTSSYDCTTAFQNAADLHRGVFVPRGRYLISDTIDLIACPILAGDGFSEDVTVASWILWTGGNVPMFTVANTQTQIRDLLIDGDGLADCAIEVLGGNSSVFDCLTVKNTRRDGVRFGTTGNNIMALISNSIFKDVGTVVAAGSTVNPEDEEDDGEVSGSATIFDVYGPTDLTTLGIRPFADLVRIGSGPLNTIQSVDADSVELSKPFGSVLSGNVEIRIGHGVYVADYNNSGLVRVEKTSFLGCAGAGLRDNGLFGARAHDNDYEGNGYGRVIGRFPGVGNELSPTIGSVERGGYFEGSEGGADIMLETGKFCRIEPALLAEEATGSIQAERIYVPDFAEVFAPFFEFAGIHAEGRAQFLPNQTSINADYNGTVYHISQSSGAGNGVINLPAMSSARRRAMFSRTEARILFLFLDVGGRTFTFKSPDMPVNGVAGTTGIAASGSWTKWEARLDYDVGWVVTN